MSESEMLSYIEQAYDCGIRSINFTGGEPTLIDFDLPMAMARSYGMYVDIRTNASWARSYDEAYQELRRLQLQGLTRLGLSYDNYHAKVIPLSCMTNVLEAARKLCVPVYLDWIGLEARKQVLEFLCMQENELRYVGPPLKIGSATKLGHEHFRYLYTKDLMHNASCRSEMLLTIFPGGYASLCPCCWVNPALIRKLDGVTQLVEVMESSPMLEFLQCKGVPGLIEKAREVHPEFVKPYYSRHCEACYDLLGVLFPGEVQELPQYIKDFKEAHL
jgi:hypothetical protein